MQYQAAKLINFSKDEVLLKKTELTMKENDSVMKKSKPELSRSVVDHPNLYLTIYFLTPKHNHLYH